MRFPPIAGEGSCQGRGGGVASGVCFFTFAFFFMRGVCECAKCRAGERGPNWISPMPATAKAVRQTSEPEMSLCNGRKRGLGFVFYGVRYDVWCWRRRGEDGKKEAFAPW
jgi:hypothetical protein